MYGYLRTTLAHKRKIIICDKNGVYGFYFASCMNITFNELCQQRVKYDVHTTSKIKHTHHCLSYIIFISNLFAILIATIL